MARFGAVPWRWVAGLSLAAGQAHAQSVLVPPVEYAPRTPDVEQASENKVGSYSAPALRRPSEAAEPYPLDLGPLRFHPHLGYQLVYGDGVLRGPNQPQTTVVNTISPGTGVQLGPHWLFDASASIRRYSNASRNDATDYNLALSGNVPKEDWLFKCGYQGAITEQPRVESGAQTKQDAQGMGVSAIYHPDHRLSFETSLQQDILLTEGFADTWNWSVSEWVDYKATTRSAFGLGVRAAYLLIDPGPDSTYQQIQARWIWKFSPKLNFQLSGGVQVQQFFLTNSTTEAGVFPLVSAAAVYQPFLPTALSVSAGQQVGSSFLQGQFTESTGVGIGLQQRLLSHFTLVVQGSYTRQEYRSIERGFPSGRKDDYYSAYAALNAALFKRVSLSVFYQFNENSSTETTTPLGFRSKQVGLQLGYRY